MKAKWPFALLTAFGFYLTTTLIQTRGLVRIIGPDFDVLYFLAMDPAIAGYMTGALLVSTMYEIRAWISEQDKKAAAKLLGEQLDTEA